MALVFGSETSRKVDQIRAFRTNPPNEQHPDSVNNLMNNIIDVLLAIHDKVNELHESQ